MEVNAAGGLSGLEETSSQEEMASDATVPSTSSFAQPEERVTAVVDDCDSEVTPDPVIQLGWNRNGSPGDHLTAVAEEVMVESVAPNTAAAAVDLPPPSPLQVFVSTLISNILEGLRGFDGSMAWLKRTSADAAARLEGAVAVKPPNGTEEFSLVWFGIASIVVHDLIQEAFANVAVLPAVPPAEKEREENEGTVRESAAVCATAREVATIFASGLQSIVTDVMNNGGCHVTGARNFSRYSLRSFLWAKEVGELSGRLMRERLTRGAYVPTALQAKYSDEVTAVEDTKDVAAIMEYIADAWLCSFFSTYQQLARSGADMEPLLWAEEEDTSQFKMELFFYHCYFTCEQKNLLRNAEGLPRGAAVPTQWMSELLRWSTEAKQLRTKDPRCQLPPFPGPIDTFELVSVPPHDPRRQWLQKDSVTYQVIPEFLFDSCARLFGGGPKYMLYGAFPLREDCLRTWKALPLTVDVTFDWVALNTADQVPDSFTVGVRVEDALLHSEMREVCHLAWGLATQEDRVMETQAAAVWLAALNGDDTVRIACKGLFLLSLGKTPLPIADIGDGMDATVQDVLQQLRRHIAEEMPGSLAEFEQQTTSSIALDLEVTLHNVNGDSRPREITGTMEVAAHNAGVCGLTNVGNTCYMNSALQCLSNLAGFRRQVLTLPISHCPQASITAQLIRLLTTMWAGQHSFAETRELKDQIGATVKRFAGYQQQDASEFIDVLLDHMSEEVNLVSARSYRQREDKDKTMQTQELSSVFWSNFLENNESFISSLFFHQSKTIFTCLMCGESSIVFDNNVSLPVSIKDPPQRRTHIVDLLVELDGTESAERAADATRPVVAAPRRLFAATVTVEVLVQSDNIASATDVEAAVAASLKELTLDSKEVYAAFFGAGGDTGDEETTAVGHPEAWWSEKREALVTRLLVEARLMLTQEHGRLYGWARCSLAPVSPLSPAIVTAAVAPALRVWYFLKDVKDAVTTTFVTKPVWVDEVGFHAGSAVAEAQAALDHDVASISPAPYTQQIISRSKEIAAAMLRASPTEAEPLWDEAIFVAADAMGGNIGYFPPPPSETLATSEPSDVPTAAPSHEAEDPPAEIMVRVMRRVSRIDPLEDLTVSMRTGGDAWLDFSSPVEKEHNEAAPPTVTTVVIFIQYDSTLYEAFPPPSVDALCAQSRSHQPSLPLPKCTLQECLRESMQADVLRGEDAWYCSQCKEFRETRVCRTLYRLPRCLIVSFKRFKMHTYSADKKDTTVYFPTELDFAPYVDPEAISLQEEGTLYRLRGVVYHSGSLSYGHYTATAFNDSMQKWVYYNDTRATVESTTEPSPNGAYILCFERVVKAEEDAT